jgi:TetR/AcrR family transcriptional regulator
MSGETRDRLLAAAKKQFAEKGFYGASIAQIANELSMTKQALLYHFKSKEQLYAEVLECISDRLLHYVKMAEAKDNKPERQLENLVLTMYYAAMENPEDSRILIRELLDNQSRVNQAPRWYLMPFMNGLVSIVRAIGGLSNLSEPSIFSFLYQVLGGVEYFVVATATLEGMHSAKDYENLRDHFPRELKNHIRRFIDANRTH